MSATTHVDLLDVGGSTSGVAAAVPAARLGLSVPRVAHRAMLGGMSTGGAVGTFCGLYTSGADRREIPTALGRELVGRLMADGRAMRLPIRYTDVVPYDIAAFARLLDEVVVDAGVTVLLRATVFEVRRTDAGTIDQVRVATVGGERRFTCAQLIDATGDATVAYLAGDAVDVPATGTAQNATLVFRMGNVDIDAMRTTDIEGAAELAREAAKEGFRLPRIGGNFYATVNPGEANCNMTGIAGYDFANPDDLTAAEMEGRRQVAEYVRFLRDRVPGFGDAYLSFHGSVLGVRESRRIVGRYTIDEHDVIGAREFPDGIGYASWPIELHAADGERWSWSEDGSWAEIPHRALLPVGLDDVQAVGRCISATPEAHASTRVIITGISMAEGAAVAAYHALDQGVRVADVDIAAVRATRDELVAAVTDGVDAARPV